MAKEHHSFAVGCANGAWQLAAQAAVQQHQLGLLAISTEEAVPKTTPEGVRHVQVRTGADEHIAGMRV
eukprot:CAMPEP_0114260522 /NCGR_PEP_ID=MMETSP0058-20121206/20544_1 /TAXON_ID=36894 /ORGANISM="Pyramimonas parkeae, CCMP726" /LENGTH=67 /DNA_ID=CAMNT_0001375787 /DNA_START=410 /DNA_END=612 /DNA_ORIENTATION=-